MMAWSEGPAFGDCIVCSQAINVKSESDTDSRTYNCYNDSFPLGDCDNLTFSTSDSGETLLYELSKILKISPTIFHGIDLRELRGPIYCSSCSGIVLNCLKILREIQNLESNVGHLINTLKDQLIKTYYYGQSSGSTIVGTSNKNPDDLKSVLSDTTESIKNQVRKTLAQCWTRCQVNVDISCDPRPPSYQNRQNNRKRNTRRKINKSNIVCRAPAKREVKKEESQIIDITTDDDDNDIDNEPSASFYVSASYETHSESDADEKNSDTDRKLKLEQPKLKPSLRNIPNRQSSRVKARRQNQNIEITIIDDSDVESSQSDSGSVYIPDSGPPSPAALPEPDEEETCDVNVVKPKKRCRSRLGREAVARSTPSTTQQPAATVKKYRLDKEAVYQRHYRQRKKVSKNVKLKYMCQLCGTSYSFQRSVKIHENRHLEESHFTCIFCNQLFYTEDKLCSHEVENHKSILEDPDNSYSIRGGILESYKCRYCKTDYVKENHYTKNDAGDLIFEIKCDIEGCNKSFSNFRLFQLHHDNTCLSVPTETMDGDGDLLRSAAADRRRFFKKALIKAAKISHSDVPRYANGRKKPYKPMDKDKDKLLPLRQKEAKNFKYECEICGKGYNQSQHYNGHMKAHEGPITAECDICGEKFSSGVALRMHKSKTHINCIRTYSGNGVLASFFCSFCKKEYIQSELVVTGDDGEPVIKCDMTGCASVYPANRFLNFSRHHQKYCFSKPQPPLKRFPCEDCDKIFGSQTNLENHRVSMHTKDYPYYCDECGRGKVSLGQLNRHKHLVHSGMLYECEKCQQRFKKKELYNVHMRRHNNDLRHMCGQCGKRFLTARHLKFHESTHIDDSDRKFPCHICGKLFKAPHYVRKHVWSTHKKGGKKRGGPVVIRKRVKAPPIQQFYEPELETDPLLINSQQDGPVGPSTAMTDGWSARRTVDLNTQDIHLIQNPEKIFGHHFPSY